MSAGVPAAERDIDEALVRSLLRDQHPDLAAKSIVLTDTGWDNVMFRLGDEFLVRLPRRKEAVPLIEHEQRWLPVLAGELPIAIPSPLRQGRPCSTYPWPWSVLPWLPGSTANIEPPASNQAGVFAQFLRALHKPAPEDAPVNEVRGVPLARRAKVVEERLDRLQNLTDVITPAIHKMWEQALAAPEASEREWVHGDLHARNVLVRDGKISGVIDWGDITAGDVATDLGSVWMLFESAQARSECLALYEPSAARVARAKGWAVSFGAVLLETGLVDHPAQAAMGEATLRRLDKDERAGAPA